MLKRFHFPCCVDLRDAIELLLCNEVEEAKPNKGRDAGKLLQKGLAALAKQPHQALGVDIGANTQEIRKAYKKLALKFVLFIMRAKYSSTN